MWHPARPAPALHTRVPDSFMVYWTNQTAAVTGNYTSVPSVIPYTKHKTLINYMMFVMCVCVCVCVY